MKLVVIIPILSGLLIGEEALPTWEYENDYKGVRWNASYDEAKASVKGEIQDETKLRKAGWTVYMTDQLELTRLQGFPEQFTYREIKENCSCEQMRVEDAGIATFYYFFDNKCFAAWVDPYCIEKWEEILNQLETKFGPCDRIIPAGQWVTMCDYDLYSSFDGKTHHYYGRCKHKVWIWNKPKVRVMFILTTSELYLDEKKQSSSTQYDGNILYIYLPILSEEGIQDTITYTKDD